MRKGESFRLNAAMFAYVAAMMMLCANSSPLYNSMATDPAVFRVMGRALAAGKVMYKDVFDHKGLYLYFVNALGVILNGKSLLGLFVVECVFMFLCARTIFALLSLYADEKTSLVGTQIFMLFALFRATFARGGMTEDYCLLFQAIAVYLLVKDGGKLSCLHMFMQGVLVGIVMCFQVNIAMMWGGIAFVEGYTLLRRKNFACLAGNIAAGILGVMAGVMPAVIYAVRNNAVSDAIFGMFGYNITYIEAGSLASTMAGRVLGMLRVWGEIHVIAGTYALILAVLASCVIVRKSRMAAYYFAMLIMTVFSIAISGRSYPHYYEALMPFCIPLAWCIASKVSGEKFRLAVILVMIATIGAGMRVPDFVRVIMRRDFLKPEGFVKANEPYKSENERVLVIGNNSIFYEIFGVVPQEKYFYIPANPYETFPEPRDSQTASILSGVNDVIIVGYPKGKNEIYPETGKSAGIQSFLESNYDVLHTGSDSASNITMYGKKCN